MAPTRHSSERLSPPLSHRTVHTRVGPLPVCADLYYAIPALRLGRPAAEAVPARAWRPPDHGTRGPVSLRPSRLGRSVELHSCSRSGVGRIPVGRGHPASSCENVCHGPTPLGTLPYAHHHLSPTPWPVFTQDNPEGGGAGRRRRFQDLGRPLWEGGAPHLALSSRTSSPGTPLGKLFNHNTGQDKNTRIRKRSTLRAPNQQPHASALADPT